MLTTVSPVDRASPLPLWAQVLEDLRQRLARGEVTDRFPTDRELMDHYGVSRHTVRDAVRRLQEEGVLERERGRGTFVRPVIEQPLGTLYSLFRSIEEQGFQQRSRVVALGLTRDPEAAEMLELAPDTELVHIQRVRCRDDEPLAVDCSWMPAARTRALLDVDFSRTALYQELADRCGITISRGWERIRPAVPTPDQASALALPAGQAVFSIERVACDGSGPVEWRQSVVRGDDYAFVARWGTGATAGAMLEREVD